MGYVEEIDLTGFDEEVVEQKSLLKDTVGKREEEEREESYLDKDEEKGGRYGEGGRYEGDEGEGGEDFTSFGNFAFSSQFTGCFYFFKDLISRTEVDVAI